MPDKWPLANGNWSNAANWNGGTKPVAGDDVYADGRILAVDENFTVATLRTTQRSGGTLGGTFDFNTAGVTGNVTNSTQGFFQGTTANAITITAASGTVTLSFNSNFGNNNAITLMQYTGLCNLTMTAPAFNSLQTNPVAGGIILINKSSSGTITLNGNVVSGNGNGANQNNALNSTAGATIVNGNVSGFGGGNSGPNYGINQNAGTLVVNGNVTGGNNTGANNIAILFSGTSLTINGVTTGGSGTGASVAISTSSPSNTVTGSVVGGANAAILYTAAGLLTISGSCTAGSVSPAVVSTNVSATNIFTGPFINTNNTMAVQCADMILTTDASTYWDFGDIILYSPEQLAYYPSASDIRQGVIYADGTVSGSLAMPPATAVIAGTPTDNTTGSAVLTPAQLQDAVWGRDLSQMTETGSIGYRLARVSTTGTTGAQIASYLL